MQRGWLSSIVCVLVLAGSGVALRAQTQSLADVARKEEERRKKVAEPAKVYTNKDLRPAPPPASDAKPDDKADPGKDADKPADKDASGKDAGKDKDAAGKDGAKDGKDPKDGKSAKDGETPTVKDRAYWSGRLKTLQETLSRDETYAAAMQSRINALTTDFVNRDDPAQKGALERDRMRAIAELDRLKQAIPIDKKAIDDLMEEARRAGVPPGWMR